MCPDLPPSLYNQHTQRYYSAPNRGVEYCDDHVCVSVCLSVCVCVCMCVRLSASILPDIHVQSLPNFLCMLPVAMVRSSWQHQDMLCTSSFTDDIIIAHKLRQLNVDAQLIEAHPTCSFGLGCKRRIGIPTVGQWTHTCGPTFQVLWSGPTRLQWAC